MVDVLNKVDLVMLGGQVFFNKDFKRRLDYQSANQVAGSWDDPELTGFLSWAGLNVTRFLPLHALSTAPQLPPLEAMLSVPPSLSKNPVSEGENVLDIVYIQAHLFPFHIYLFNIFSFAMIIVRGARIKSFTTKVFPSPQTKKILILIFSRKLNSMLRSMNDFLAGLESGAHVVVIGATNRPNSIEPALRSFGPLDKEINIGVANEVGGPARGFPTTSISKG